MIKGCWCGVLILWCGRGLKGEEVRVEGSMEWLEVVIGEEGKMKLEVRMDGKEKLGVGLVGDRVVRGVEIVDVGKGEREVVKEKKGWVV